MTAWVVAGCGGEPPPRAVTGPSILEEPTPASAPYPSPAEWRFHPREAAPVLARATLADGRVLAAGKRGERWVVNPRAATAEAAAEPAPEDLVAIVPAEAGRWLFLGRSGTSYEADAPLGAFVRASAPLEPFVRVRAAASALVGIRRDGALLRSDTGGASWQEVGPAGVRFQDVALASTGAGLALAVPEALWQTRDAGATWAPTGAPAFGAEALVRDDTDALGVVTFLGFRRFAPGQADPFPPGARGAEGKTAGLGAPVPVGESAAALADGRAALVQGRWLEARPAPDSQTFRLVTGPFGGPLTAAPLPRSKGCQEVRLAAQPGAWYLACARARAANVSQPIELFRSTDDGKTWAAEPYTAEGQLADLSIAVAADGNLVATGLCPASARGPGCRPAGVHVRRATSADGGPAVALVPAATPGLVGPALALVASLDGRHVYALGRSAKGDELVTFVSHDGGATFGSRVVEGVTVDGERGRAARPVESAAAAEDGTVAFVVSGRGKRTWLVVDEDGRALSVAEPPVPQARVGVAGQRALAVDGLSRDAWESLDGGASWTPLGRLAVDPCPGSNSCAPTVTCTARGCVLADVATRVGWAEPRRAAMLLPPSPAGGHRPSPKVGAALSCALDPGDWQRLVGVHAAPDAAAALIGKATWFARRVDPSVGSVSVVHVRGAGQVAVDEVTLLDSVRRPEDFAFTVTTQVEGVAALRYALPTVAPAAAPTIRRVEVAWDDVLSGRVVRTVLPDAGPYRPGDFGDGRDRAKLAATALLSIAQGGAYVRLHGPLADAQPTYFLDGRGVETVPPVPWPPRGGRRGQTDMVHVGRAHVPLLLEGTRVARARRGDRGWSFDAASVGFTSPREHGLTESVSIAYLGDRAGLHVVTYDAEGGSASGVLLPFRADGAVLDPPTAVPTQLDLPVAPRGCTQSERAGTPRVVVPFQPGTRHPVLVTEPGEPPRTLLTGDAVLHGTPAAPCVAAWDATQLGSEVAAGGHPEQALVPMATPERSFLFRAVDATRDVPAVLEWRTMTCRVDPGADVPVEVYREQGTLR